MVWTLDNNMADSSFFCAKLTSRRGGHIPFAQTGAEASDTRAEAVKPDPRCSWQSLSGRVDADVWDESTESRSVVQLVIRPLRRTYVVAVRWTVSCVTGTNRCLDLSCRAFPTSESVRAGWSRCTGSMARCARNSAGSFATKLS